MAVLAHRGGRTQLLLDKERRHTRSVNKAQSCFPVAAVAVPVILPALILVALVETVALAMVPLLAVLVEMPLYTTAVAVAVAVPHMAQTAVVAMAVLALSLFASHSKEVWL